MRILHCLLTREFAGTERHVAELANQQALTHDVTVLLERHTADPRTGGDIARHFLPSVRIVRANRAGYLPTLFRVVRSETFDIVHTHLGKASIRAGVLKVLGLMGKTPVIGTLHNAYRARTYGKHDGLICIARWQQDSLPEGCQHQSILIANWTVPSALCPLEQAMLREAFRRQHALPPGAFVICAVGRMVEEKRFDCLLQAWRQAALPTDTYLVLVGDGPERVRLENVCADYRERIIFAGYRSDVPDVFCAFDGFVLPSRREPFGLVLLEAMAAGLPVCATAAGGVLDILENVSDCLVKPDCIDALAAGLVRLRQQPGRTWDLSFHVLEEQALKTEQFYRRFC
ncbi:MULTISPECIES: glycosyltransferase [unclassified Gluconobacter]|uniref:glycosyltransferase n=1 Tax=unclassified Gluconobacter TaxID=2644261 RepID=UPI001C0555A1